MIGKLNRLFALAALAVFGVSVVTDAGAAGPGGRMPVRPTQGNQQPAGGDGPGNRGGPKGRPGQHRRPARPMRPPPPPPGARYVANNFGLIAEAGDSPEAKGALDDNCLALPLLHEARRAGHRPMPRHGGPKGGPRGGAPPRGGQHAAKAPEGAPASGDAANKTDAPIRESKPKLCDKDHIKRAMDAYKALVASDAKLTKRAVGLAFARRACQAVVAKSGDGKGDVVEPPPDKAEPSDKGAKAPPPRNMRGPRGRVKHPHQLVRACEFTSKEWRRLSMYEKSVKDLVAKLPVKGSTTASADAVAEAETTVHAEAKQEEKVIETAEKKPADAPTEATAPTETAPAESGGETAPAETAPAESDGETSSE